MHEEVLTLSRTVNWMKHISTEVRRIANMVLEAQQQQKTMTLRL